MDRMLSRSAAEAALLEKAARDPEFRDRLLTDPRAAIEQTFGIRLPAATAVTVLEEKPAQHYLVLPLNPEKSELGAAELDAVSAGACYDECDVG